MPDATEADKDTCNAHLVATVMAFERVAKGSKNVSIEEARWIHIMKWGGEWDIYGTLCTLAVSKVC